MPTLTTAPPQPSTRFEVLSIEQIEPHPHNVRVDVGDVDELTESIRAKGVLQPLLVAPLPGAGSRSEPGPVYVLIAGHRRRAAAFAAGLRDLPCVVREDLTTEAAQLEAMLVENLQRTDLTAIEEGDAYQALLDLGDDVKQISAKTGRAARTVKDRLAIAHLPESARSRVTRGQVTIEQAMALAEFTGTEEFEALQGALGSSQWSWTLQRARERRDQARAHAKALREAKKAGVTVLPRDTPAEHVLLETLARRLAASSAPSAEQQLTAVTEDHVTCPGHVLVDTQTWNGVQLLPGCTQPDLHPVPESPPDPEAEARAAKAAQERADLETAAKVRRALLHGALERPPAGAAERLLRDLANHALTEVPRWHRAVIHELLEVDEDEDLRALRKALDGLTIAQLAVVLDVIQHTEDEAAMQYADRWPARRTWSYGDGGQQWREHLVDVYGHEWSDVESALLERPAKDADS